MNFDERKNWDNNERGFYPNDMCQCDPIKNNDKSMCCYKAVEKAFCCCPINWEYSDNKGDDKKYCKHEGNEFDYKKYQEKREDREECGCNFDCDKNKIDKEENCCTFNFYCESKKDEKRDCEIRHDKCEDKKEYKCDDNKFEYNKRCNRCNRCCFRGFRF